MGEDTEHQESEVLGAGDGLTISEAAKVLDISPGAVRKRIRRGTLPATKSEGQWYVLIDRDTASDAGLDAGEDDDLALDVARSQMEVFRDSFVTPLVEKIAELEHSRGSLESDNRHLREERERIEEEAKRELDRLRQELEAKQEEIQRINEERHKSFWERLFG